jgi:peptidoglycan hydrolase CwlO-like protein
MSKMESYKMNKKLMILMITTVGVGSHIQAHGGGGGGWGGFGGGLLTGVAVTSAINSGNRSNNDPAYWDYKRDRYADQRLEREVRDADRKINKLNRGIDRLMKQKDSAAPGPSKTDLNRQIEEKREQVKRLEEKRDEAQARRND